MDILPDPLILQAYLELTAVWIRTHVFTTAIGLQVVAIGATWLVARAVEPRGKDWVHRLRAVPWVARHFGRLAAALEPLVLFVVWLALQWLAVVVSTHVGWPTPLGNGVVSLLTAWVVIRLVASVVRDPTWSKVIALMAWTVAALNILNLLSPTIDILDDVALRIGDTRVSLVDVIKGTLALAFLLWLASGLSSLLERRIAALPGVSPSARVLFSKLVKIALFALAVVLAMDAFGVDLTALAVFSGALGLGIGFGLQKVFGNLVSGVILLLDKSVKPGDVIAIGGTFGWIRTLGGRYVSVITRDGIEHLIPNEELISQRVENWSYSDRLVRQKIPIGVSYDSDVPRAMALAEQAATATRRVLAAPAPACRLMGFGDSSVDLELRVWIEDPERGVANVRSEVLLAVWRLYHDNGIEFPFPQRDLHIRSSVPLKVERSPEAPPTPP